MATKTKGKGIYVSKKVFKGERDEKGRKKYDYERTQLTNKEIRESIMKNRGWSREQYKKQYDILRNKLRAYENYQAVMGREVERQSVQELLYKESKAIKKFGSEYVPSLAMQEIRSFSSVSSGRAGKKALANKAYREKANKSYSTMVLNRFAGLIKANPYAAQIAEELKDNPVQLEDALADFADAMHIAIGDDIKKQSAQAIFHGQSTGSPDSNANLDIDNFIESYL